MSDTGAPPDGGNGSDSGGAADAASKTEALWNKNEVVELKKLTRDALKGQKELATQLEQIRAQMTQPKDTPTDSKQAPVDDTAGQALAKVAALEAKVNFSDAADAVNLSGKQRQALQKLFLKSGETDANAFIKEYASAVSVGEASADTTVTKMPAPSGDPARSDKVVPDTLEAFINSPVADAMTLEERKQWFDSYFRRSGAAGGRPKYAALKEQMRRKK